MRERFELAKRVAVVTGAASGLGRALAQRCAAAGMRLVLADVNGPELEDFTRILTKDTQCRCLTTDVRHGKALQSLAELTYREFGAAHVLFNNAGVVISRSVLETSAADCQWMLDVNFWGVFHGVAAFLPRMIAQDEECRIVNTASAAGFLAATNLAAYCVSKHAVVAYSECLQLELEQSHPEVGVSIVSPAFIPTNITKSERWRPDELSNAAPPSESARSAESQLEKATGAGRLSADDVARMTLEAVNNRRLYVFPHLKIGSSITARFAGIEAAFRPEAPKNSDSLVNDP